MRKIKTWLRTSIQQKEFKELSVLCIEKGKTKVLSNEAIFFVCKHLRYCDNENLPRF